LSKATSLDGAVVVVCKSNLINIFYHIHQLVARVAKLVLGAFWRWIPVAYLQCAKGVGSRGEVWGTLSPRSRSWLFFVTECL